VRVIALVGMVMILAGCSVTKPKPVQSRMVLKTVLIRKTCDCGGEMRPTGMCYTTNPPTYAHACTKCSKTAVYYRSYPSVEYEANE